jgi:plasmid stabilization system protein ParE
MYTVVWAPLAEQELAEIWNDASDRAEITAAANEIDSALVRDPLDFGEARQGITRIAFEKPLAILFDVHEDQQKVRVWDIWRWPS